MTDTVRNANMDPSVNAPEVVRLSCIVTRDFYSNLAADKEITMIHYNKFASLVTR